MLVEFRNTLSSMLDRVVLRSTVSSRGQLANASLRSQLRLLVMYTLRNDVQPSKLLRPITLHFIFTVSSSLHILKALSPMADTTPAERMALASVPAKAYSMPANSVLGRVRVLVSLL